MNSRSFFRVISRIALVISSAVAASVSAQETNTLPLSEPGPYAVGTRELTFIDESRDAREVSVTVWYPAVEAAEDALPDLSAAPYPLILYSHGQGGNRLELAYLTQHLATHGFVVAAMEQKGRPARLFVPTDVVDQPMDVLFVLDQLASLSEGDLVGIFDSDNTGVAGYSGGGYDAIMVSGARWDEAYRQQWCAEHSVYPQACSASQQIRAYRERFQPAPAEGELWQPFADERIKAVLPLTGGPGPVFGERGLASANVPMLLIAGTADWTAKYEWAAVFVYEHWGVDERYLISIIGADHVFGYGSDPPNTSVVMHFATAFFGYYLRGQEECAQYLTEDYVNSIDGLVWGPYQAE